MNDKITKDQKDQEVELTDKELIREFPTMVAFDKEGYVDHATFDEKEMYRIVEMARKGLEVIDEQEEKKGR